MQSDQHEHASDSMLPYDARKDWVKVVSLMALAAVSLPVFAGLFRAFQSFGRGDIQDSPIPWTFHTIWEVLFLVLVSAAAVRLGSRIGTFVCVIFLGCFLSAFVGLLIPDSFSVFRPQYFGIESRSTQNTHEVGRHGESEDFDDPLVKGSLYHKDDPEVKQRIATLAESNEYAAGRGFLFWQTGMATGYDPSSLDQFNGGKGFPSRVELFFTVGPLVIVESTLNGLTRHFPVFMLLLVLMKLKCGSQAVLEMVSDQSPR